MEYPTELVLKENLIFDSHAHLDDTRFDGIRDELLSSMNKNGVCGIISCGCDTESSKRAIELSEKYGFVYSAVGYHPENLKDGVDLEEIERLSRHKKCVAIGEIGLDYYWEKENADLQKEVFKKQLELAKRADKPVIIHDRDAHGDTLEILKKYKPAGVLHCFSGSYEMAEEVLKMGMYIGVGGVITFKNAKKLPDVVRDLPADRLLLETDCPYLAPEPFRGKLCFSGMIKLTAEKIAEIRGVSAEEILKISKANAERLFLR